MQGKAIQALLRNGEKSFAHKESACAKISQSGLVETNSTFNSDQAQVPIDPPRKTKLELACVECYILSIGHGSYMHMLAHDVHVDNNTFGRRPWKKVLCV